MRKSTASEHPRPGAWTRWRARRTERMNQRLLGSRMRRRLAASARRAAGAAPLRSRHAVLLNDRAAAVRNELLEIAFKLERAPDLDASWVADVHKLLTDGCDSPLYNSDIHISELRAALYYLRGERQIEPAQLD